VNQLCSLTLPLFGKAYPGHQALFYLDNATNNAAYAPGRAYEPGTRRKTTCAMGLVQSVMKYRFIMGLLDDIIKVS
jgi:hypothetical protein